MSCRGFRIHPTIVPGRSHKSMKARGPAQWPSFVPKLKKGEYSAKVRGLRGIRAIPLIHSGSGSEETYRLRSALLVIRSPHADGSLERRQQQGVVAAKLVMKRHQKRQDGRLARAITQITTQSSPGPFVGRARRLYNNQVYAYICRNCFHETPPSANKSCAAVAHLALAL